MYLSDQHAEMEKTIEEILSKGYMTDELEHKIIHICAAFYNQGWDDAQSVYEEKKPKNKLGGIRRVLLFLLRSLP
jgi:uncharacterized protein (DUF2164 family)